ncbi:response regulator transcription factor [Bdellovibrionota bacterium FG-1]
MKSEARKRVLVAGSLQAVRNLIEESLSPEFVIFFADDGASAVETTRIQQPDIVLLNLDLPRMGGVALCESLRISMGMCVAPILIVSERDDSASRTLAFQGGADDYVVIPFAASELLARVRAKVRSTQARVPENSLSCGDISLDFDRFEIQVAGVTKRIWMDPPFVARNFLNRDFQVI